LADIAILVASGLELEVTVCRLNEALEAFDAVIITDVLDPQGCYDAVKLKVTPERLLTPRLLHVSRGNAEGIERISTKVR